MVDDLIPFLQLPDLSGGLEKCLIKEATIKAKPGFFIILAFLVFRFDPPICSVVYIDTCSNIYTNSALE